MSEPNLTSCNVKFKLWPRVKNMTNENEQVPQIFRDKCPCILLNNSNMDTGTYFDKTVKKSECQIKYNNNKRQYNYEKYIGKHTVASNKNSNGKVIYYIYVYYSNDLLNFINNYKDANYFTVSTDENKNYIAISSYYKDLIIALANALHKQKSNSYNTQGNKSNNIPLYPIRDTQTAGSRKKVKTHRKNKIVTINKQNRKTKKRNLLQKL